MIVTRLTRAGQKEAAREPVAPVKEEVVEEANVSLGDA
jgi:hypothetical protein